MHTPRMNRTLEQPMYEEDDCTLERRSEVPEHVLANFRKLADWINDGPAPGLIAKDWAELRDYGLYLTQDDPDKGTQFEMTETGRKLLYGAND